MRRCADASYLMRLSPEEALRRGLIDKSILAAMRPTGRRGAPHLGSAVAKLNAGRVGVIRAAASAGLTPPGSKGYTSLESSPQKILFDALCARFPDREVIWEAGGLIPGRKFSADILIRPRLVVEMDGFAFHRSKGAYQADRDRQNLYVAHGFLPIRAYAKQVFDRQLREQLLDVIAKALELTA